MTPKRTHTSERREYRRRPGSEPSCPSRRCDRDEVVARRVETLEKDRVARAQRHLSASGGATVAGRDEPGLAWTRPADVDPVVARSLERDGRVGRVDLEDLVGLQPADLERGDPGRLRELLRVFGQVERRQRGALARRTVLPPWIWSSRRPLAVQARSPASWGCSGRPAASRPVRRRGRTRHCPRCSRQRHGLPDVRRSPDSMVVSRSYSAGSLVRSRPRGPASSDEKGGPSRIPDFADHFGFFLLRAFDSAMSVPESP